MRSQVSAFILAALLHGSAASAAMIDFVTLGNPISFDFQNFTGAGFTPNPLAGQLDSDQFRVTGLSVGSMSYGSTAAAADYALGSSTGGVSTGGVYAFNVGAGDIVWGIQPNGTDFTPGTFEMRVRNLTGSTITAVALNYEIWTWNDQERRNSFNFSWATGSATLPATFTSVDALDYSSPEASSGSSWTNTLRSTTLSLTLVANDYLYLRWTGNDASGVDANRDEFGLDDITLTPTAVPEPGALSLLIFGLAGICRLCQPSTGAFRKRSRRRVCWSGLCHQKNSRPRIP